MLLSGWNLTVTAASPWAELERRDSIPATPTIAVSMGVVINSSTCSAEKPGDSTRIETWGGANSGKTSYLICEKV